MPTLKLIGRPLRKKEQKGLYYPAEQTFATRWDKVDSPVCADFGDIGEDADGIYARQHPVMLLAHEPELAEVVSIFQRTGNAEVTREDLERMSAFEVQAFNTIQQAHVRGLRSRSGT